MTDAAENPAAAAAGSPAGGATPKPATPPKEGVPGDLPGAFVDAFVQAAKAKPASTADPLVSVAFMLGWRMAELYHPRENRKSKEATDDLPGLSAIGKQAQLTILVNQIQASICKLEEAIDKAKLPLPDVSDVRTALAGPEPAWRAEVLELHRVVLTSLTGAEGRLGKAYGLGRALADTCQMPNDRVSLDKALGEHRLANLLAWLDDLSSVMPPHAAHSVGKSIERWHAAIAPAKTAQAGSADAASSAEPPKATPAGSPELAPKVGEDLPPKDDLKALRRQGELWRALLSGEKQGTETLETENYLDAARSLTEQIRALAKGIVARFRLLAVLILVLLAAGIVLLAWGGGAQIVGGAGSLIAALGLTWKGVGGTLGQLAGKVESPLWAAALDEAIADAITLLPDNQGDHKHRRMLALQMPDAPPPDGGGAASQQPAGS